MVGTAGLEASEQPTSVAGAESSAAGAYCGLGQAPPLQSFTGSSSSLFVRHLRVSGSRGLHGLLRETSDEGRKDMGFSPQVSRATIEECESNPDSSRVPGRPLG